MSVSPVPVLVVYCVSCCAFVGSSIDTDKLHDGAAEAALNRGSPQPRQVIPANLLPKGSANVPSILKFVLPELAGSLDGQSNSLCLQYLHAEARKLQNLISLVRQRQVFLLLAMAFRPTEHCTRTVINEISGTDYQIRALSSQEMTAVKCQAPLFHGRLLSGANKPIDMQMPVLLHAPDRCE